MFGASLGLSNASVSAERGGDLVAVLGDVLEYHLVVLLRIDLVRGIYFENVVVRL
jgi:hypothetical protein